MKEEMKVIREFMVKHRFAVDAKLPDCAQPFLLYCSTSLREISDKLESLLPHNDDRHVRAHLMIEELSETLDGLAAGDPLKTLDSLADLLYVVIGTAVAFGLPLYEAFWEVHWSNMTKAKRIVYDPRLRNKGASYWPPDLKKVLKKTQLYRHTGEAVEVPRTGSRGPRRQSR